MGLLVMVMLLIFGLAFVGVTVGTMWKVMTHECECPEPEKTIRNEFGQRVK